MKTTMRSQSHSQSGNIFANNLLNNVSTGINPNPHFQTSLYATNGSIIKEFISKKQNFVDEETERRPALINRYGFIACLLDGFNSDGNKRLEINLPDSADLSINQNGGFSIHFWFLIKKQSGGVHRFIIKRGNTVDELTPSVGVLPNGTNIFIKINSSKHRIETLFSNKKIETNRMYSMSVTFSIDYANDLTDISLFLDGLLDSQITVPGEPLHNQGNLYIGKSDSLNYGFSGCVADIIIVPRVLNEIEISKIHKECIINLNATKNFGSYEVFSKKFERDTLMQKYSNYTGNPEYVIENLDLTNDELREIVKKFDNELKEESNASARADETAVNNDEKILQNLQHFLGSDDSDATINCKKIAINARFIYTVLFLVNTQEDEIDFKRVPGVFEILKETLHIDVEEKFFKKLAEILNSFNNENKCVKMNIFFKNLKFYASNLFQDLKYSQIGNMNQSNMNNYNSHNKKNLDLNSVELHENLLLNSQNFKNYIDDDLERSLAKSTFSIRSLYARGKSGRPATSKGAFSNRGDDGDYVNQQFDNIPEENKHELMDEDLDENDKYEEKREIIDQMGKFEDEIISHAHEQEKKINDSEGNKEVGEKVKEHIAIFEKIENDLEKNSKEKNEIKTEEKKHDELKIHEDKDKDIRRNSSKNDEVILPNNNIKTESKEEVKSQVSEEAKENIIEFKQPEKNKENVIQNENMNTNNLNNINSLGSTTRNKIDRDPNQTNFDDVISNYENKVIIGSSGRDSGNRFLDPDNMIPLRNLVSQDLSKNEEVLPTVNDLEPKFPNDWNDGSFEIVISHCYDCHSHTTTTRHYEYTFVDKFNEIGDFVKSLFPNVRIVGNVEKPEYLGSFDVYLRGVGPRLDDRGRFFIYRKIYTKKFPTNREIGDKLIALSMLYGSSNNMEAAQNQFMKAYQEIYGKDFKDAHEFPLSLSEEGEKVKDNLDSLNKKQPSIDPERTKLFCQNWGCGARLVQIENGPNKCSYHPGVWQFGSYHGYWPEAWSCCEKGWDSEGCTRGPHKAVRLDSRIMLCTNHGEINPAISHPESACGAYYTSADKDPCKFHSGFINKSGNWNCCGVEKKNYDGCKEGDHATVEWPDEKAKLYFFPKPVMNPGVTEEFDQKKRVVANQIIKCDYFKQCKPYDNSITKMELLKIKREKEKDEPKYCLRWACDKIYKDTENTEKSCRCHPGKWDHGSTGSKMVEFVREVNSDPKNLEKQTILWRPHWTCCRQDWNKPGCKKMKHRGILLEDFHKNGRKYKWPDQRLKLHFPKIVSDKWKSFLERFMYPEATVKQICKKFFSEGRKTMNELPSLCDALRLYFLVVSDNVEYQMKFMDIATSSEIATKFFVVSNYVDGEKFVKWWFMDYEKIYETVLIMIEQNKK